MNPERIQHHRVVVRPTSGAPSNINEAAARTTTLPSSNRRPSTAGCLPGHVAGHNASPRTAAASPSAPSTPADSKPSRPATAAYPRFGTSTVTKTSSGRVVIETVLSPREVTMGEPFQPSVLYHHSQAYRWCPPVPTEGEGLHRGRTAADTADLLRQHIGPTTMTMGGIDAQDSMAAEEQQRLAERLRVSEQRVVQRRAPRRPQGTSLHRNEPPSLQLLVARLRGEKRSTLLQEAACATQQSEPESRREEEGQKGDDGCDQLDNPSTWASAIKALERLQPVPDATVANAVVTTAAPVDEPATGLDGPTLSTAPLVARRGDPPHAHHHSKGSSRPRAVSLHSTAHGSSDGVSDFTIGAPTDLSKTEAAVMATVLERQEHLKEELVHARTEIRRMELQESLDELSHVLGHCRSLVAHVNMSHLHERSEFHSSLLIDHMSSEELNGRLMYGETLRKLLAAQQRARREALEACLSAKSGGALSRGIDRMDSARERRLQRFEHTMGTRTQANADWKARASVSTTLSYQGRLAMCAKQAEDRRATHWFSVMLLFTFPRNLIKQRAARMERLLLSKKRKEEHVAHFVRCMRDCLHRRRVRVARLKLKMLQFAFRLLVAYADHKKRRAAVGEIIAWYHEYARHKPATDMIQKFKKAIVRCQSICRQWLQRRRAEVAWSLLKLFQRGENYRWTPPAAPPGTVAPIHRLMKHARNANPTVASTTAPSWLEPLIETIVKHVIPPFHIRVEAIQERWRAQRKAYVAALAEHLHKNRIEKKRRALLARRGGYREHDALSAVIGKVPEQRARPMHNILPTDEMVDDIAAAVDARFTIWLRARLLQWTKTQQAEQQLQAEQQQQQPPSRKALLSGAAAAIDALVADEERVKKSIPSMLVVSSWVRDTTEPKCVATWGPWVWHSPIGASVIAVESPYAAGGGGGARRKLPNPSAPAGRVPSVGGGSRPNNRDRLAGPAVEEQRPMKEAVYLYQRALRML